LNSIVIKQMLHVAFAAILVNRIYNFLLWQIELLRCSKIDLLGDWTTVFAWHSGQFYTTLNQVSRSDS